MHLMISVSDPERFDAVPDPTFQADADPKFVKLRREIFSILYFFFSTILKNLSCVIFSVTMREEGLGVRDKV